MIPEECPVCHAKGTVFYDEERGVLVCWNCGYVLEDYTVKYVYDREDVAADISRGRIHYAPMHHPTASFSLAELEEAKRRLAVNLLSAARKYQGVGEGKRREKIRERLKVYPCSEQLDELVSRLWPVIRHYRVTDAVNIIVCIVAKSLGVRKNCGKYEHLAGTIIKGRRDDINAVVMQCREVVKLIDALKNSRRVAI